MGRIWAEHVEQTKIAEEKAAVEAEAEAEGKESESESESESGSGSGSESESSNENGNSNGKLIGENKYDLSVKTTYEYDVVACEDYEENIGMWIRNMPEEIRSANPDFVPS